MVRCRERTCAACAHRFMLSRVGSRSGIIMFTRESTYLHYIVQLRSPFHSFSFRHSSSQTSKPSNLLIIPTVSLLIRVPLRLFLIHNTLDNFQLVPAAPSFALKKKTKKKYKPVAERIKPIATTLPDSYRIIRNITGELLADLPSLSIHSPEFIPQGRYTEARKEDVYKRHEVDFLLPDRFCVVGGGGIAH